MIATASPSMIERCSDGVEEQGAEEASWGIDSSVFEAVARASGSTFSTSDDEPCARTRTQAAEQEMWKHQGTTAQRAGLMVLLYSGGIGIGSAVIGRGMYEVWRYRKYGPVVKPDSMEDYGDGGYGDDYGQYPPDMMMMRGYPGMMDPRMDPRMVRASPARDFPRCRPYVLLAHARERRWMRMQMKAGYGGAPYEYGEPYSQGRSAWA
jgi:hypothetical protein